MYILDKIGDLLERLVTLFGRSVAWLVLLLVAVTVFDVVSRRFFVLGSTRLQELEWHLHTILMMFVIAFGLIKNTHVRVDIVRERLSSRTQNMMELIGHLIFLIPFTLVILFFGAGFVKSSFVMGESSPSISGIPYRWIIKSTMLIGFFLLLLAGFSGILKSIRALMQPDEQIRSDAALRPASNQEVDND